MIRQEEVYKIGRLGKAHGVKGEVSFQFDDDIFDRVDADYLVLDIDGILVPFFMEEYRFRSDTICLVKFKNIDTQQRAQELTGCDVFFPRALAEEGDEMPSLSMLVGFEIIDISNGKTIGRIAAIDDVREIGYVTRSELGACLIARGSGEEIELKAQGWQAFGKK